jgi:serine/threonine-protein kinase HipA
MNKELAVYLNTELAGTLDLTANDEMSFTYSQTATRPVSVGMPFDTTTFGSKHCEAFFGGLLPEGDEAKKALGRRFGISSSNTFSLLRAIGAECAGALSIIEAGSPAPVEETGEIRIMSEGELAEHIRELPQRPLFVGVNGIRLSLSGVQDKAAVSVVPDGIGIPAGGPTTHIIKPDLQRTSGIIYCEHLCLKTASRIGITAASVELKKAEDQVYLLVERYDRQRGKHQNELKRVHQEDFCQALAIPSKNKYQEDGGPKLKDCFQLLNKTAVPAKERLSLLTAVIFNFLVGNMDAHGKNFSLLHSSKGIRLAPLYDIVCTAAFPEYAQKLAMDIGDYYEPAEIYAFHWRTLCEDIGYSYKAFQKSAKTLYTSIPAAAEKEYALMQAQGWSHPACERAIEIIKKNCSEMETRLNV